MGKNSDTKNIIDSYFGGVLLKESPELDYIEKLKANKNLSAEAKKNLEQIEGELKGEFKFDDNLGDPDASSAQIPQAKSTAKVEPQNTNIPPAQQPKEMYKGGDMGNNNFQFDQDIGTSDDEFSNLSAILSNDKIDPTLKKIVQDRLAELKNQQEPAATQPAATQPAATQPAATQPAAKSSGGGSVVDYLAGSGQASDFGSRSKLAAQYGIQNYKGTAEQNTQLLNKLKSGEKPAQQATTQAEPKKQQGMGGAVGGVSKAVGSAGQGLKQATIGTKKPLGGVLGGISKVVGSAGKGIKKALVGDQEESEETFVQFENNNIAKFLKCLSEKDYSKANKYLKAIVDNKINRNVLKNINNKY